MQEELGEPRKTWSGTLGLPRLHGAAGPRSHPPRGHACVEGLLTDISDAALWRELNSERYTSPCCGRGTVAAAEALP